MKIISLILSSGDLLQYNEMRDIATVYHTKMSQKYDYKFFFVEMREDLTCDAEENGNYIYVRGKESITPGMYEKTMVAIEYLHCTYDYDYIVRTNLSSFWNIPKLFDMAKNFGVPYAGGHMIDGWFITGTGIVVSRDVAHELTKFTNDSINEDVLISSQLKTFVNIDAWNDGPRLLYMIDDGETIPDRVDDIIYIRVKNTDRAIDVRIFKKLLRKIYSIDYR